MSPTNKAKYEVTHPHPDFDKTIYVPQVQYIGKATVQSIPVQSEAPKDETLELPVDETVVTE
jgi:hypothetical protein